MKIKPITALLALTTLLGTNLAIGDDESDAVTTRAMP
tara:strand:- start:734 stop:844 length:111 start_codon:yes stop_codon:yes gene_type:complete